MLEAFHRKILRITGDADKTYEYRELQSADELANHIETGLKEHVKRTQALPKLTEDATAKLLAERSADFSDQNEARLKRQADFKERFNSVSSLSRFVQLLRMGLRPSGIMKTIGLTAFLITLVGTSDVYIWHTSRMYSALLDRDKSLLFRTIGQMTGMALLKALVLDAMGDWLAKSLSLELNTEIVRALSNKVMINANFYRMKNVDGRM